MRSRALAGLLAALLLTACGGDDAEGAPQAGPNGSSSERQSPGAGAIPRLGPARSLGQLLVGRYSGTAPSRELLARVRAGRLGGVIFFADNVAGNGRSIARSARLLQRAARAGDNPPLLLSIDQEGGVVKRLPGPPGRAAPDMRSPAVALRQGRLAGRYLRGFGINLNLAPVVDVPTGPTFIRDRTFGETPAEVANRACAFARGLVLEGVGATLKHFPGLGLARENTDFRPESVQAPASAIRAGYAPYRRCGQGSRVVTMVSSAVYPRLTGPWPAVVSPRTYSRERSIAGASRVTISDDLQTPALEHVRAPAGRAIRAGLNLALYASTEAGSATAYRTLMRRMHAGALDPRLVMLRARPVLALKADLEPARFARQSALDR